MKSSSKPVGSLKIQKLVSRDDANGMLSTPTRRKGSYFFNSQNVNKVKETSQTPTNKHSKNVVSQWQEQNDIPIPRDEIEAANMLANEANLGFGDLINQMKTGERSHSQMSDEEHKNLSDLEIAKKKSSDPNHAKSSATGSSAPKNYYHEFKKVQESFRRNSGLLVSQSFASKEIQTRRSSFSQGRNTRSGGMNLVDESKMSLRNRNTFKYRLIRSPLGLTSFRNHQIDEVAEDGVTEARD